MIWRKLDCLKPNLQWYKNMPTGKTPETGARSLLRGGDVSAATFEAWTMPNEGIKGNEWDA